MVISRSWHTIFSRINRRSQTPEDGTQPKCNLGYIPVELRTGRRQVIDYFEVGECLYHRCKPEVLENPYASVSLTELSHNRGGLKRQILCEPDDVLLSIREDENFQKYKDRVVCILHIKDLNQNNKYRKEYQQEKNGQTQVGVLELFHEPVPCMYPHSVLRVTINGEIVTYENHAKTLGKLQQIRTLMKNEIASMIWRSELSQSYSS